MSKEKTVSGSGQAGTLEELQRFLVEEFPLEMDDEDSPVVRAITIMKKMKSRLNTLHAADMVFPPQGHRRSHGS